MLSSIYVYLLFEFDRSTIKLSLEYFGYKPGLRALTGSPTIHCGSWCSSTSPASLLTFFWIWTQQIGEAFYIVKRSQHHPRDSELDWAARTMTTLRKVLTNKRLQCWTRDHSPSKKLYSVPPEPLQSSPKVYVKLLPMSGHTTALLQAGVLGWIEHGICPSSKRDCNAGRETSQVSATAPFPESLSNLWPSRLPSQLD
jgi:hypothetical protein